MAQHPHTDAEYAIAPGRDGDLCEVKVTIPGQEPTRISGFPDKLAAEAWITRHKEEVAAHAERRSRKWRRSGGT